MYVAASYSSGELMLLAMIIIICIYRFNSHEANLKRDSIIQHCLLIIYKATL